MPTIHCMNDCGWAGTCEGPLFWCEFTESGHLAILCQRAIRVERAGGEKIRVAEQAGHPCYIKPPQPHIGGSLFGEGPLIRRTRERRNEVPYPPQGASNGGCLPIWSVAGLWRCLLLLALFIAVVIAIGLGGQFMDGLKLLFSGGF